jgi:hypothetical protein
MADTWVITQHVTFDVLVNGTWHASFKSEAEANEFVAGLAFVAGLSQAEADDPPVTPVA